jgi:hypothetical protein
MANLNFPNSVNFTTPLTLTPEFNFFLSLGGINNNQLKTIRGSVRSGGGSSGSSDGGNGKVNSNSN